MLIISATVGSGSSFIAQKFAEHGWEICLRPDKYMRKHNSIISKTYKERLGNIIKIPPNIDQLNNQQLCELACDKLMATKKEKLLLLSMSWGGLGYLQNINAKKLFIIRHPLYAFNSYSGGGWRKTHKRTKAYREFNDWADEWLNDRSHWIEHTQNAIIACKKNQGYIVRYEKFKNDWKNVPLSLPPIHREFKNRDDMRKVEKTIPADTINYLMDKTSTVWDEVINYA
jgi:hypothetical protein